MCCATDWIDVNVKHMTFNFPELQDASSCLVIKTLGNDPHRNKKLPYFADHETRLFSLGKYSIKLSFGLKVHQI
jgi:hypothetical protein